MQIEIGTPLTARLAVFSSLGVPPEVEQLEASDPSSFSRLVSERVLRTVCAKGGDMALVAIVEIVDNLLHASYKDVSVTIPADASSVMISDHGPGISDKVACMALGYTSADAYARHYLRGVGAGFAVAEGALRANGGSLQIADNLGGGLVVTLSSPHSHAPLTPAANSARSMDDDSKRVLLLLAEIGQASPTTLADELRCELDAVMNALTALLALGLLDMSHDRVGLTAAGLKALDGIFCD